MKPTRAVGIYRILPHTADAGFEATASDLGELFKAAGRAVADLSGEAPPGTPATAVDHVELAAVDLPGLAFAWLNELVGLIETRHGVIVQVDVEAVGESTTGGCFLRGRAGTAPFDSPAVRPRRHVKAATFHGLRVERGGQTWTMVAYLDV